MASHEPAELRIQFESPDQMIDITAYRCPMTFVRTRLALDRMGAGQVLLVRLSGQDARINVPRSVLELGHAILSTEEEPGGATRLLIRKSYQRP